MPLAGRPKAADQQNNQIVDCFAGKEYCRQVGNLPAVSVTKMEMAAVGGRHRHVPSFKSLRPNSATQKTRKIRIGLRIGEG
jgi:hypothetical protein